MKKRLRVAMMISGTILLLASMLFSTVSYAAPGQVRENRPPACHERGCNEMLSEGDWCAEGLEPYDGRCRNPDCPEEPGCACPPPPECEAGETRSCDTGQAGVCGAGTQTCSPNGSWGDCVRDVDPSGEVCDGLDNDCDGETDEGCECTPGQTQKCGSDEGECVAGTQTCVGGQWGDCAGAVGPSEEVCDGKDNDCDGETDEGGVCVVPTPTPQPHCPDATITVHVTQCDAPSVDASVELHSSGGDRYGPAATNAAGRATFFVIGGSNRQWYAIVNGVTIGPTIKVTDCGGAGAIDPVLPCGAAAPVPTPTSIIEVLGVERLPVTGEAIHTSAAMGYLGLLLIASSGILGWLDKRG